MRDSLAGLAQLLKAPRRLENGCGAPLRIGVQNVHLQQLSNGVVQLARREKTLPDLKLCAGGGRTPVTSDDLFVCGNRVAATLLVFQRPAHSELCLVP